MQSRGRFVVGVHGFIDRHEVAESLRRAVHRDSCAPTSRCRFVDTLAGSGSSVLVVRCLSRRAQVRSLAIQSVEVDVIDDRPRLSVDDETMEKNLSAVDRRACVWTRSAAKVRVPTMRGNAFGVFVAHVDGQSVSDGDRFHLDLPINSANDDLCEVDGPS